MDNKSLYNNILDIYNILPSKYANKYLNNYLNENALMNIIFSKFSTDTDINNDAIKYINYILKNNNPIAYEEDTLKRDIKYYKNDMIPAQNAAAYSDVDIVDFDISLYASDNILRYLFYLDTVVEIYQYIAYLKSNNQSIISHEIVVKSRYSYTTEKVISLYQEDVASFEAILTISRIGIKNTISDLTISGDKPVKDLFESFKPDIIRHLMYFEQNDLKNTDISYINTVISFYKLCRLKLMYSIIHSIELLKLPEKMVADIVKQYILPVFMNFKKSVLRLENPNENLGRSYSTEVVGTTSQIKKLNQKIDRRKINMKNNANKYKSMKTAIQTKQTINTFVQIVISCVILVSILLFVMNFDRQMKITVSIVMVFVVIIMYIILYSISTYQENFVDETMQTSSVDGSTTFPKHSAIGNVYVNKPFEVTRIYGSTSLNDDNSFWNAFDGNDSTGWNSQETSYDSDGNAVIAYKDNYKGEYLIIDLCQYISIRNYTIISSEENSRPFSFKLYATVDESAWNMPNSNKWVEIDQQTNVTFENNKASFTISDASLKRLEEQRIFMLIINRISGNGDHVNIRNFHMSGNEVNIKKTFTYISKNSNDIGWDVLPSDIGENFDLTFSMNLTARPQRSGDNIVIRYNGSAYPQLYPSFVSNYIVYISNDSHMFKISDIPASANYGIGLRKTEKYTLNLYNKRGPFIRHVNVPSGINPIYEITLTIDYISSSKNNIKIDKKKLIDEAIATAKPVDSERLSKQVLDKANLDYAEYVKKIKDLNAAFAENQTKLKADITDTIALAAQGDLGKQLEDSRKALIEKEAEIVTLTRQVEEATAAVERELANKNKKEAENTSAATRQAQLLQLRNETMTMFETYQTASEKAAIASAKSLNADNAYQLTVSAAENALRLNQATVDTAAAKYIADIAAIDAQQSAKDAEIAAMNLEMSSTNYENQKKKALIDLQQADLYGTSGNNGKLSILEIQEGRLIEAKQRETTAIQNTVNATNDAMMLRLDMNYKYDMNTSNSTQLNQELLMRRLQETQLKATAERERAEAATEEARQDAIYLTADSITITTNDLITDINNSIAAWSDILASSTALRDAALIAKQAADDELQEALNASGSGGLIADANARYREMDLRTASEIANMRFEKTGLVAEYARQFAAKEESTRILLEATADKEKVIEILEEKTLVRDKLNTDITEYNDLIKDYEITDILKDSDLHILKNLNDNMSSINNDAILPGLRREKQYFEKYESALQIYTHVSDAEKDISKLDDKAMDAYTHLLIHIAIIIGISMILYSNKMYKLTGLTVLILLTIAFMMYQYNTMSNVRTMPDNYYWGQPISSVKKL